jgi:hypothetical protein
LCWTLAYVNKHKKKYKRSMNSLHNKSD